MSETFDLAIDFIGVERRLRLWRAQLETRYVEQAAYDLFLQNLVKGTTHLGLGQEAVAAGLVACRVVVHPATAPCSASYQGGVSRSPGERDTQPW